MLVCLCFTRLQTKSLPADRRETKVYVVSDFLPVDTLYKKVKITDTNNNSLLTTVYAYIALILSETFEVLLSHRLESLLYKSSSKLKLKIEQMKSIH